MADETSPQDSRVMRLFHLHGRLTVITGMTRKLGFLTYPIRVFNNIVSIGVAGGLGACFAEACIQAGGLVAGIDLVDEPGSPLFTASQRSKYYRFVSFRSLSDMTLKVSEPMLKSLPPLRI